MSGLCFDLDAPAAAVCLLRLMACIDGGRVLDRGRIVPVLWTAA
jgi:hypothetical protein